MTHRVASDHEIRRVSPTLVAIVGYSGSGKTTLIENLIPLICRRGIRVATIKHDVHGFQMDKPGKDSWRHKHAGAEASVISSAQKVGLVMDADHDHSPVELAAILPPVDLIMAEGYKHSDLPKIEIFRPDATGGSLPVCRNDDNLLAVVTDEPIQLALPVFATSDYQDIVDFITRHFRLTKTG